MNRQTNKDGSITKADYFVDTDYENWTTTKLKQEAKGYDTLINTIQCYGMSDLRKYEGILQELENRGVEVFSKLEFN
jgi:hypothetical protein